MIVQSFSLREAKDLARHGIQALYLVNKKTAIDVDEVADAGIRYLGVPHSYDKGILARAAARGINVRGWTINDPEIAREWSRAGANGIFTDEPLKLRAAFEQAAPPR